MFNTSLDDEIKISRIKTLTEAQTECLNLPQCNGISHSKDGESFRLYRGQTQIYEKSSKVWIKRPTAASSKIGSANGSNRTQI